ncbi:histidine kinase [Paenibacillus thalictri]|uniref:Sensor histidine kinase n=1 Tax=Paenibacillus thalictri TaxID=2527873 RepID=A0A4Q9DWB5_9BACL|nr:histidine kinase [Paenibacillus thalictri]TBL80686.1 sensor histidine kinase [Paenibacillus thalictri]
MKPFHKLLRRLRSTRLATKMFLFLFFSSSFVLALLAWNTLGRAEEVYKSMALKDSEIIISRTNEFIDSYLDNVQTIMLQLAFRRELFGEGLNEKEKEAILREYVRSNGSVLSTLYVIPDHGNVVSSTQLYYSILGNPHLTRLVKLAKLNYGAVNWSEPYESPLSQRTMAFVTPVSTPEGRPLGVVVLEIDLNQLSAKLSRLLETEAQSFTVLSAEQSVVASNPQSRLIPRQLRQGNTFSEELIGQLADLPIGTSRMQLLDKPIIAVKSNTNRLGWSLISIFDEASFFRDIRGLYTYYRDAALYWVVLLCVGSYLLSRYFTLPIKRLALRMDRVKALEFHSVLPPESRGDEIGELARSYHAMMERIRSLSQEVRQIEEQKRDYEIRMLQSQIGPHFLHNTLACIESLAFQQKIAEVQMTIHSLTGLLSLSIGRKTPFITLKEELQGLHMFVQIQNIRYGKQIALNVQMSAELGEQQIPRLTLQPIIENAIFHGIVPTGRRGKIGIKVVAGRNGMNIFVRDNGIGMEEAQARSLLGAERGTPSSGSFNSLGLANVNSRLQLYYGSPYGLKIRGRLQKGTVVRVRVPLISRFQPISETVTL